MRNTVERLASRAAMAAFPRGFHERRTPTMREFDLAAHAVHRSGRQFLGELLENTREVNRFAEEYAVLREELDRRYEQAKLSHPRLYAVADDSSLALYAYVRKFRPQVLLETGVANGHSSFFLLNALLRNDAGMLYSIDVSREVGCLLSAEEKRRWQFRLLDTRNGRRSFNVIVQGMPEIDFFLHDSDHSYQWLACELHAVWPRLSAVGAIACDDPDLSLAFLDFATWVKRKPVVLVEPNKILAFLLPQSVGTQISGRLSPRYRS